jgi:IS605 OrfB family transposase
MKATEALASGRKLKAKGRKVSCPKSERCAIRYDAKSSRIDLTGHKASLLTMEGRTHVTLSIPPHHASRLAWKIGSADLVEDRKRRLWLHVTVESPDRPFAPSGEVVGIDLGVVRPAVTSNAQFLGQRRWREVEAQYFRLRRSLQANGSKSAKRHLKRLALRLGRFRRDCDHALSRQIVDSVEEGTVLALEDLTDIRIRMKGRKIQRRRLHSWSFDRLQGFLGYKAALAGVGIAFVDPRYTSQKCSKCGHREKGNRKSQSEFRCKKCGFRLNADLNAARNIRANHLVSGATSAAGGLSVNQPIVAGAGQGVPPSYKPPASAGGS